MKVLRLVAFVTLACIAVPTHAATSLPGFALRPLGQTSGFLTSLAVDSKGTVYYTAQDGTIYRFANGQSTPAARVAASLGISDAGLLGMALIDDDTAGVHYTVPAIDPQMVLYDVVSRIDLRTGAETVLKKFVCDIEVPERGVSMLHHGGNPVAAPDGSLFVGIGDYGGRVIAQLPNWNGGKIWRVYPDGNAVQYVLGLRNPFDFVWDDPKMRLIVPDNGDEGSDELTIVTQGANCGYPWSFGSQAHFAGSVPPAYVWEPTISPCGTIELSKGANDQLRSGILIVGYVSKGVHYFPDIDASPLPEPLLVLDATKANAEFVDVAEAADGTLYLADGFAIYRMETPRRGDCNGDGAINTADIGALSLELADGPEARMNAQNGSYAGSWGCDVNGDDRIDDADMTAMAGTLGRRRGVRVGR